MKKRTYQRDCTTPSNWELSLRGEKLIHFMVQQSPNPLIQIYIIKHPLKSEIDNDVQTEEIKLFIKTTRSYIRPVPLESVMVNVAVCTPDN